MSTNNYEGALDSWMVELAKQRARRYGFRGADLDDALQEVALELLAFRYDPAKSNGASAATAVTAVIDNRLAMLCRRETRYQQRLARAQEMDPTESQGNDGDLPLDVQSAVEELTPLQRQICHALSEGYSLNEVAARLGRSWCAVRDEVFRIRRCFELLGLGERVPSCREEVAA